MNQWSKKRNAERPFVPSAVPGDLVKTVDGQKCSSGLWLNQYPSTAQGCLNAVIADSRCDNLHFSWADRNDNNCLCATPGTDCPTTPAAASSTWKFTPGTETRCEGFASQRVAYIALPSQGPPPHAFGM